LVFAIKNTIKHKETIDEKNKKNTLNTAKNTQEQHQILNLKFIFYSRLFMIENIYNIK